MADEAKNQDQGDDGRFLPNNQIWMRRKSNGAPYIFETDEQFREAVYAYLEWINDNPLYESKAFASGLILRVPLARYPTMRGLALFIGVSHHNFDKWNKPGHHLEEAMAWAHDAILQVKMEGGAAGFFNQLIVARDVGLTERSEVKTDMSIEVVDKFIEEE